MKKFMKYLAAAIAAVLAITSCSEEKKKQLFLNQKQTLDLFLERKAISQAQYDKSLGDLREKMGFSE